MNQAEVLSLQYCISAKYSRF